MLQNEPIVLGWREWLALPQFGIAAIKAKIDSGARTSSLHVESLDEYEQDGRPWLRFSVLTGRRGEPPVCCAVPAADRRAVSDSGGHVTLRWFIRTEVELAGQRWESEMNLTGRHDMLFPLLLGRNALSGRFLVDPAAAYRCGRPAARRRRRTPR
ncbi:MAG TPA: RimK/LysX family protein [Rudaea sp.]|nr:RimK/LysX family protein [Rudaea sp.]